MSKFISSAVAANNNVLYINVPKLGNKAEVGWFNTESNHSATAAGQEYVVEGWVKLA